MSVVYSQPKLIMGEGKADKVFFDQLFKAHSLQEFQSDSPVLGPDKRGGASKFGTYLLGISVSQSFIDNVKKIVMVGDNDEANSFANICDQLVAAGYTRPTAPKQFVQTTGKPDIAVLMIPDAHPGCLETLCFAAASTRWQTLPGPLNTYLAATPAASWSSTKQDKMRVQCVLASTCQPEPNVALHDHWLKRAQYHIPVTDPAFQSIVTFLSTI
jgi:hypothetical protein